MRKLFLTPGAVVGAAAGTANFLDGGAAARAGGAVLTKHFEVVGKVTILAARVFEMLKGGATNSD